MVCMVKGRDQFEVIALCLYIPRKTSFVRQTGQPRFWRTVPDIFTSTSSTWLTSNRCLKFSCVSCCPWAGHLENRSLHPKAQWHLLPTCKLKLKSKTSKTLFFLKQSDLIIIIFIKNHLKSMFAESAESVNKMTCVVMSMQSGLNASGPCVSHLGMWLWICTSGFFYSTASGTSELLRTGWLLSASYL